MKKILVIFAAIALSALWAAPAMALADLSVSYDYFLSGTLDNGQDETDLDSGSLLRAKVGLIGFVAGLDYSTVSGEADADITTTELRAGYGLGLVAADLDFLLCYNTTTWEGGGNEVEWTSYGVGVDALIKAIPFITVEAYYTYFLATEVNGTGVPLTSDEGTGSVMGIRATYNVFDGFGVSLGYRTQTNELEISDVGYDATVSGTSLGISYRF